MKTIFITFVFAGLFTHCFAQGTYVARPVSGYPLVGGKTMDMNVTWKAIDVSAFNGIAGSPFLSTEYRQAFIKTRTGEQFNNAWIKFSTYSNEILLENASQLVALTNVDSVSYLDEASSRGKSNVILKTGYPAIENKTSESIYHILAYRNDLQFLKYYHTKVEMVKKMGMPDQKTFVTTSHYYLYNSTDKSMKRIKLNKSLIDEFTSYEGAKKRRRNCLQTLRKKKK
ncbi:hypothetical protein [Niabella hibiscisoli]|uniref:hypothetical protein n=1 Tax=Niabella hibiscisoli TaxID=1825928 RepID=UPI001F0D877C|nr:hypothetical protein [Niabella hibiscisoli]MCH5717074.1 hypothetical protein [Niabella hibiscisoli]